MLVVAVDAERGQQDRDDEGEEDRSCDHSATQLIAQWACGGAQGQVLAALRASHCEGTEMSPTTRYRYHCAASSKPRFTLLS